MPHQHHDELGSDEHSEEHAQAEGVLDYLQLLFHTDLGDGHMENFENSKGFDLDVEFTFNVFSDLITDSYYPLFLKPSVVQKRISNFDHGIPILKKDVIAHLDFRGPPSIA